MDLRYAASAKGIVDTKSRFALETIVSSRVMHLDLLLKLPPDEVFFDFLAQCGLALHTLDADDAACERLRIAVEIERAPLMVRESILAAFHQIALLADETGLEALREAAAAAPGRDRRGAGGHAGE